MSDKFLKNMKHMLENTQSLSLKILFEEKEESSDDTFDAFGSVDSDKDTTEPKESEPEGG